MNSAAPRDSWRRGTVDTVAVAPPRVSLLERRGANLQPPE